MVPDPPDHTRRALLRGGLLAALGLAGCFGGPDPGTPDGTPIDTPAETPPTDTPDSPPTDTPDETPTDTPDETPTDTEPPAGDAVRWTYRTGGRVRHPPTVHDGVVYAGGGTNDRATSDREYARPETSENVYALDASDGTERWRYEATAGVASSPVVRDGSVLAVVGWSAGTHGVAQRLVRLDADGATRRWETDSVDRFLSVLDVADGTAHLGTSDDAFGLDGEQLFAVSTNDGRERWRVEAGDTMDATVRGDTLYAAEGGRTTTAFATGDGSERWHRAMPPVDYEPRPFGETLYLESEQQNANGNYPVVAVSAADGSERWRFSAPVDEPFVPTGAVASDDAVYVTEYGGWLFALDPTDGTERWRRSFDGDTRDPPALVDGTVYLTTHDGGFHAVDGATGDSRWSHSLPGFPRIADANAEGIVVRGFTGKRETRYVRAYGHDGTERWAFSHVGDLTRSAVDGTSVYVGTKIGYVVALGAE